MSNSNLAWSGDIPTEDGFYFMRIAKWVPKFSRTKRPDPILVCVDDGAILGVKIGGLVCPDEPQTEGAAVFAREYYAEFLSSTGADKVTRPRYGPADCEYAGPFNPPSSD